MSKQIQSQSGVVMFYLEQMWSVMDLLKVEPINLMKNTDYFLTDEEYKKNLNVVSTRLLRALTKDEFEALSCNLGLYEWYAKHVKDPIAFTRSRESVMTMKNGIVLFGVGRLIDHAKAALCDAVHCEYAIKGEELQGPVSFVVHNGEIRFAELVLQKKQDAAEDQTLSGWDQLVDMKLAN